MAVLFVAATVWFFLELFGVFKNKEADNQENNSEVIPIEKGSKCFAQFQDFIKDHGANYSECLVDFDFNEEYCSGFDPDTQALSDVNIVVILDSSGSMAEEIYSEAKIDIAKKAVSDFLTKMPQGVNTGLVVYGHKGSNSITDKDLSCKGIEEVVKLGRNNYSNIISAMNSFQPKGWTPIAGSLDFLKNIFNSKGENNKNYLILLSDGAESCNGDPLVATENLKLEIPGIKLIVIGFATDSSTQQFLTRIANAGGGLYLNANNSSEIAEAFNDQLLMIKKDCLNMTFLKMSSRYDVNKSNNLNCWLSAYKKESNDFEASVLQKSIDPECISEISDVLRVRHTEFWRQKQDLEQKNDVIYNNLKSELNNQLKSLEN